MKATNLAGCSHMDVSIGRGSGEGRGSLRGARHAGDDATIAGLSSVRPRPRIPIFQESYVEPEAEHELPPAVTELVSHQGIALFDISGHYIEHAVADLARMVKSTITGA